MAEQRKIKIDNQVQKNSSRKFKIKGVKKDEVDLDIEIDQDGEYEVVKLSTDTDAALPTRMRDGNEIRWFNNFYIKKTNTNDYINQPFKVIIPGLASLLGKGRLVIFNGNGDPFYYEGDISTDTVELTDGDPAIGGSPPSA